MSASLRPLAPAELYAAACNPPRRAKRRRADSPTPPVPPASLSGPEDGDGDEDEDDADDPTHHPPPKRRGRRPGTLSRAAREAQRKINHSLIEKARRTKINDALAALRELVPSHPADPADASDADEPDPRRSRPKPKAAGEKEFKLEILVRTVAYLQDLTERVRRLERDGCPRCSEPISLAPHDAPSMQRCSGDAHGASPAPSPAPAPSRLPSIASWLPDDPRPLLCTPSQSPAFDGTLTTRPGQLPTPPTSAVCAPATAGFPVPPVLTLPSPSTFLPPTHMQPRFFGFTPRANPKASPVQSPVYTPEDETAASLLLRMSATSARTAPKPGPVAHAPSAPYAALTPSRLLGLSADR